MKTDVFKNKLEVLQKMNEWSFDLTNADETRLRDALLDDIIRRRGSITGYEYIFELSEKIDDDNYFYARFNIIIPFVGLLKINLQLSHKGVDDIKRSVTHNTMYLTKDDVKELDIYRLVREEENDE